MVALGRAVIAQPRLFVIDELTLGLSPVAIEAIVVKLFEVLDATGAGLLLVEQNARLALDICDYGYVLDQGRLFAEGSTAELAADVRVQHAYLGNSGHLAVARSEGDNFEGKKR